MAVMDRIMSVKQTLLLIYFAFINICWRNATAHTLQMFMVGCLSVDEDLSHTQTCWAICQPLALSGCQILISQTVGLTCQNKVKKKKNVSNKSTADPTTFP